MYYTYMHIYIDCKHTYTFIFLHLIFKNLIWRTNPGSKIEYYIKYTIASNISTILGKAYIHERYMHVCFAEKSRNVYASFFVFLFSCRKSMQILKVVTFFLTTNTL